MSESNEPGPPGRREHTVGIQERCGHPPSSQVLSGHARPVSCHRLVPPFTGQNILFPGPVSVIQIPFWKAGYASSMAMSIEVVFFSPLL